MVETEYELSEYVTGCELFSVGEILAVEDSGISKGIYKPYIITRVDKDAKKAWAKKLAWAFEGLDEKYKNAAGKIDVVAQFEMWVE